MTARPGAVDWSVFPCALGDVVVRASDGAEVWLAGALVLREDAPAAVIFIAPDASFDRAVYARPRPSEEITWLVPIASDAILVGSEPPSAIELDGARFDRVRRLPLRVERLGEAAPDVGATAILGEYASPSGEVVIVLVAAGVRAWRGTKLGAGEFDVWRGGRS
jgi:hypothetical protein